MTTINLDKITLYRGGRKVPRRGYSLMEVVSLFAGEPLSDSPECVSPVLQSFGTHLNERWDDEQRQKLKPFIPLLPGTAGDGQDEARGFLALDWLIRGFTPAWLHLVPALRADANLLAGQGPITTMSEATAAGKMVHEIAPRASAARAATKASWAVWDTTGDATAWASRAASWAAWTAAGDAAWASRSAARDALTTTVDHLQESALLCLFHRLIDPSAAVEETACVK